MTNKNYHKERGSRRPSRTLACVTANQTLIEFAYPVGAKGHCRYRATISEFRTSLSANEAKGHSLT